MHYTKNPLLPREGFGFIINEEAHQLFYGG